MAQINIDPEWFVDERRDFLAERLPGGTREADGLAIEVWLMAQDYWTNGGRLIPLKKFQSIKNHELFFECGLAKKRGGRIYIKGSKIYFNWLKNLRDGARKGGKSKGKSPKPMGVNASCPTVTVTDTVTDTVTVHEKREWKTNTADAAASAPSELKFHRLIEIWNENCGQLPRAKSTTSARNRHAGTRWKEAPPGVDPSEYYTEIVKKIVSSDFCNGKNERGWKASVDWLLKPDTHLRVSEGKYENKKSSVMSFLDNWKENDT